MTIELNSIIADAEHSIALYGMDAAEHSIYQTYNEACKAINQAYNTLRCAVKERHAAWNART